MIKAVGMDRSLQPRPRTRSADLRAGFTLIEVVAVMLIVALVASLAALPAEARDRLDPAGVDAGDNPGELDKGLGVTVPLGAKPDRDAQRDRTPVNCGETVTTTLDASGNMIEHVTPKPCP